MRQCWWFRQRSQAQRVTGSGWKLQKNWALQKKGRKHIEIITSNKKKSKQAAYQVLISKFFDCCMTYQPLLFGFSKSFQKNWGSLASKIWGCLPLYLLECSTLHLKRTQDSAWTRWQHLLAVKTNERPTGVHDKAQREEVTRHHPAH